MAKLLNDKMSSQTHMSNTNRHIRLCNQTQGAEDLSKAIALKVSSLKEKNAATLAAKENRDAAYDVLVYKDAVLDDVIRNISDSAKQYDRRNPGRPTYNLLFPDGKYSDIIRASFTKEVGLAIQLSERLTSLGAEHELNGNVAFLTSAITDVQTALTNLSNEDNKVKVAVANEELAQADLRQQYEYNYLDATKLFGKKFADRLFPKTAPKPKEVEEEVTEEA
ncbi:hypothetical protein [Marinifilum flexuosum]|uniref:hypothetical protein n=1 Tax=Marinifilum flexuosum TaxID=1117708 RepID=UPI00249424C5|nr:hypothetical protein [Marinifilum flexuosum]